MNKPKPRQVIFFIIIYIKVILQSAFIDTNDIKHLQEQIQKVKKDKEEM